MATAKKDSKLVMVADDDEDLAFLVASQLIQAGVKVQQCIGGTDLVANVLKYKPDLVLLDIAMQQLDGSDLCREIKNDARIKHTKVILMSGNHDVAKHAASCGADGYVAKPLSVGTLKTLLSKYV